VLWRKVLHHFSFRLSIVNQLANLAGSGIPKLEFTPSFIDSTINGTTLMYSRPRFTAGSRGVNGFHLDEDSIWVNTDGEYFVNECFSPKQTLSAVLKQPSGSHWSIFDEKGRETFVIAARAGATRKSID